MHALSRAVRAGAVLASACAAVLGPWLDLAIRLAVAQTAFVGVIMTMMGGSPPPGPVMWPGLYAVMASDLGMAVRAICPALLSFGLLSRTAALAMVVEATFEPMQGDTSLFWTALLLRVVVIGPGALSLDALLHRGAESIAIPGTAWLRHVSDWIGRVFGPIYHTGLRVWLALILVGAAVTVLGLTHAMQPGIAPGLPNVPSMVASLAPWLSVLLAVLLATGTMTRAVALFLLALIPASHLAAATALTYWALLLAIPAVYGGGPYAIDQWLGRKIVRRGPVEQFDHLPHVVVVGGGFGGVATVRGLRSARCRITLIDQRNYHLFQPLLYQVATAGLSPADIATPVRAMFRNQSNVRVLLAEVTGVDPAAKTVRLDHGALQYDYLVLATGARHSYFGRDDWAPFAPGLKTVEDGTAIRRKLLLAFEKAENAATDTERRAWLTFVIVGGGPTGVELAGAIAELAHHGLAGEFRQINPAAARVLLVQSGPRLLPAFPEALSREAERALTQLGVEIQLDRRVQAVDADTVTVSGEVIAAGTVLWAAGVMASPAAEWLGLAPDRSGRIMVGADLSVPGLPEVFAIGDTAASSGWGGQPVPGLAPAAKQGGAYVAHRIGARIAGRPSGRPFRYRHLGSLATIGRQSAVADFGFIQIRGALAWWLWGAAHVAFLVGGRNRLTVLVQWFWAYVTFSRGTRLITGGS